MKTRKWSFDPRKGLTLKYSTVFDSSVIYFAGIMPSLNGKRVDIPYDEKTERFRSWFFPNEKKNSIDVTVFVLFVTGNRIKMIYIILICL